MADYGMMLCEELMEAGWDKAGIGAGIGAASGAGVATAVWAKKRLALNKKLKACTDDACRAKIKAQIKSLRGKALKYGAATTVAGAGLGAAAGKHGSTDMGALGQSVVKRSKQAKDAVVGVGSRLLNRG